MPYGPIDIGLTTSFVNDVQMVQHRVVVKGSDEAHINLPSGNDPTNAIGVARDGNASGSQEAVREAGYEWVEAGGTCTSGKPARILANGLVEDVQTNATPTQQSYIGFFRSDAASGDLALVKVDPGFITQ